MNLRPRWHAMSPMIHRIQGPILWLSQVIISNQSKIRQGRRSCQSCCSSDWFEPKWRSHKENPNLLTPYGCSHLPTLPSGCPEKLCGRRLTWMFPILRNGCPWSTENGPPLSFHQSQPWAASGNIWSARGRPVFSSLTISKPCSKRCHPSVMAAEVMKSLRLQLTLIPGAGGPWKPLQPVNAFFHCEICWDLAGPLSQVRKQLSICRRFLIFFGNIESSRLLPKAKT